MAEMHDATEEYLETILELEEEGIVPIRARLVERLGVSAPRSRSTSTDWSAAATPSSSTTAASELTTKGRELATTVVRRHRLAERLLVDVIGLEWEKVHREADRWEHAISADVEEKLVELLGDPATCPHGNPIPGSQALRSPSAHVPLLDATPGEVTVVRISEKLELDDAALHLLADAHLIPGETRRAHSATTATASRLRTSSGEHSVPQAVAMLMWVTVPGLIPTGPLHPGSIR